MTSNQFTKFFEINSEKKQNFDERNWKTLKNFKPFEVDG